MPDRSIVARLRAEASQFITTMGRAAKATEAVGEGAEKSSRKADAAFSRMQKSVQANAQHINRLGNTALVAGGAITAGLGFGIKAFADFDQAMSAVNAALPEAAGQMDDLRAAAIKLGSDTQFSATEAAQGITELGKAGVSAGAILDGGLKGALDLAASGQLAVADAAEIAATAMVQFGLSGAQVPHIADLLAAGAGKAQGSVGDLGMALKQAGLVADQTGLSIEETAGGLAAFASAGLVGSDAGTSFKTMLQRLTPQSDEAQAKFDELGVSAYDASGNFVGLSQFAGQLQTAMKDLTPEARNAALTVMFGSDAVRGANVLYEQGARGIAKWVGAVNDAGFAADQARKLTDNLKGDLERLGGAIDAVFVQNGEGANGALRNLVQGIEGLVEGFGRLPQPAQQAALGTAAVTGATLLAIGVLAKGVTAAADFSESLGKIRETSPRTAKGIDLTTKAIRGLGVAAAGLTAIGALESGNAVQSIGVEQLTRDLLGAGDAVEVLDAKFKSAAVLDNLQDSEVKSFGDALRYAFDPGVEAQINDAFDSLGAIAGIEKQGDIAIATKRLSELDATLTAMASGGHASDAAALFERLTQVAKSQGVTVDQLKQKFPQYAEALAAVDNAQTSTAESSEKVASNIGGVEKAAEDAQEKVADLADEIRNFGKTALNADEAQDALEKGTIEFSKTIKDNAKAVKDGEKSKREAYLDNKDALRGLAELTLESSAATLEQTGSAEQAATAMRNGRADFIAAAGQLNITGKAAEDLADKYGLIPQNVTTTVKAEGAELARTRVQNLIDTIKRLNSKTVTVGVRYTVEGRLPNGGVNTRGGSTAADGGMFSPGSRGLVRAYADGGVYQGSLGAAQPQIRPAGGAGILWAEEGAGPWESFISGHPAKRGRSRMIARDTVERLGGRVEWVRPFADGGMLGGLPTSHSVTHDSRLMAEQVTIVTPNPGAFTREFRTAPYRAKARPLR